MERNVFIWLSENAEAIDNLASEGQSNEAILDRLECMNPTFDFAAHKDSIRDHLAQYLSAQFPDRIVHIENLTINVNTITDSPHATLIVNPPPEKKSKRPPTCRKLKFILLDEPELTIEDRIVYSHLWTTSSRRQIRDNTDIRWTTVNEACEKLKALGLVNADLKPNSDDKRILRNRDGSPTYRKMEWMTGKVSTVVKVFDQFIRTDPNPEQKKKYGYYSRCLGIPRQTYYDWKKQVATWRAS